MSGITKICRQSQLLYIHMTLAFCTLVPYPNPHKSTPQLFQCRNIILDFTMMCRSSYRLATKRSLDDMAVKNSKTIDNESFHRPTAGDTAENNDCGVLPGE